MNKLISKIIRALGALITIFTLLFLAALPLHAAEGIPDLINYNHTQYRAETQNWAVAEDHRGFIYVANLSGVLEYDGINWRLIKLPGNLYATSLAVDEKGTVYVGSHSEFGILETDKTGYLVYKSLLHYFPEKHQEFSFIWKIEATEQGVFFSNYDNLFRLKDTLVTVWDFERYSSFFVFDNQVLVYDNAHDKGLLYLEGNDLKRFTSNNSLAGYYIAGIFPYDDDQLLLYSLTKGFLLAENLLYNHKTNFNLRPLDNQIVASFLSKHIFTGGLLMQNGQFAFATQNAGVVFMEKDGSPGSVLNESMGLQNETVNSIYEDSNHILWLALDNGLTSVNKNLGISYWNNLRGVKGSVLSFQKFNEHFYIGTWQGIYSMPTEDNLSNTLLNDQIDFPNAFQRKTEIDGIGWKIIPVKNQAGEIITLMFATSDGLYSLTDSGEIRLLVRDHFYDAIQSDQNPSYILAAGGAGLHIYHFNESELSFTLVHKNEDLKSFEVFHITEDRQLNFWLAHRNEGIARVSFIPNHGITSSSSEYSFEIDHFTASSGIFPKGLIIPFRIGKKVLFLNELGLKHFIDEPNHPNSEKFQNVNYIVNLLLRKFITVRYIESDSNHNLWLQTYNKKNRIKKVIKLEHNAQSGRYSLNNSAYSFLSGSTLNDIYFEKNSDIVWFIGDDALYKYQNNLIPERDNFFCYMRSVKINNHYYFDRTHPVSSQNSNGLILDEPTKRSFGPKENNISFNYTIANFFLPRQSMFSTMLEGMEKNWSDWSQTSEKHYTNLPADNYVFKVKGKDTFGRESQVEAYHFRIKAPWYFRTWAYGLYLVLLFSFIVFITRTVNKSLIKAKITLESKIADRTAVIEEKQKQIEKEKLKADQLLQNILPTKIANELKVKGNVKVQYYDLVTIMFMDFKDFSKISQFINPLALINELDNSFCTFDEISQKHNLEKIKTIGDAYMCAGGIPEANLTNPFDAILAGFDILNFIQNAEKEQWLCDIRIGIHTGEIMAGIIGKNKFAYDIWGESVNTASRMEQKGEENRINISGETYELVKDFFKCEYRGKLEAKHQNQFDMYFVNRIKEKYSKDSKGTVPNDLFWLDVDKYLNKIPV